MVMCHKEYEAPFFLYHIPRQPLPRKYPRILATRNLGIFHLGRRQRKGSQDFPSLVARRWGSERIRDEEVFSSPPDAELLPE